MRTLYTYKAALYFQTQCLTDTSFPQLHRTWWKLSDSVEASVPSPGTEVATARGLAADHAPARACGPLTADVE